MSLQLPVASCRLSQLTQLATTLLCHPPAHSFQPLNFPFPGAPGEGAPLPLPGASVCSRGCQGTMPAAWRALSRDNYYLPSRSSEYRSRCSRKGPGEDHLTRRCGDSAGRMAREGWLWNLPAGRGQPEKEEVKLPVWLIVSKGGRSCWRP